MKANVSLLTFLNKSIFYLKVDECEMLVVVLFLQFHSIDDAVVAKLGLKVLLRCVCWNVSNEESSLAHYSRSFCKFPIPRVFGFVIFWNLEDATT